MYNKFLNKIILMDLHQFTKHIGIIEVGPQKSIQSDIISNGTYQLFYLVNPYNQSKSAIYVNDYVFAYDGEKMQDVDDSLSWRNFLSDKFTQEDLNYENDLKHYTSHRFGANRYEQDVMLRSAYYKHDYNQLTMHAIKSKLSSVLPNSKYTEVLDEPLEFYMQYQNDMYAGK